MLRPSPDLVRHRANAAHVADTDRRGQPTNNKPMRLVPFNEVVQYDIKEKIPAFRGKITKINDYNVGERNGDPWSIQNLELCNPDDPKQRVRVKLWNREEVPKQWIHKIAMVECVEGERGPKGVTMEQDTYRWREGQPIKKQVEVQCGDGAMFYLASDVANQPRNAPAQTRQQPANAPQDGGGGRTADHGPAPQKGSQAAPANQPAPQQQGQGQSQTHARRSGITEEDKREAVAEAAKFVARKVSGFRVVLRAMDILADERSKIGRPLTPEQFQGMTTSIFIAGDRAFKWDLLPMTEELLEKYWPQPSKPANTQQPAQ